MTKKQKIILAVILIVFLVGSGILAMTLGKYYYGNRQENGENLADVQENTPQNAQASAQATHSGSQKNEASGTGEEASREEQSGGETDGGQATAQADAKTYTPTFMFFYSEADPDNEKTQAILAELQKTYTNIKFDIRSIDAEPELVDKFPVQGNTPMLIMLNTKNDISALVPMCKEKDKMEEAIQNALQ